MYNSVVVDVGGGEENGEHEENDDDEENPARCSLSVNKAA